MKNNATSDWKTTKSEIRFRLTTLLIYALASDIRQSVMDLTKKTKLKSNKSDF